jgi:Integrase zinc binding domain
VSAVLTRARSRVRPETEVTGTPMVPTVANMRPQSDKRTRHKLTGMVGHTAPRAVAAGIAGWTADYLAGQQAQDVNIAPALKWLCTDLRRPDWNDIKSESPALRSLWQQYESLIVRDNVLYRIFHSFDGSVAYYQLVLPSSLEVAFLEMIHADAAGHLKFAKCIYHVQRRAWWFTWRRDLKLFIQCCALMFVAATIGGCLLNKGAYIP